MEYLAILLFALAVSNDGLVAGMSYGINKIKLPVVPLLIISSASGLAVSVSMLLGKGMAVIIPAGIAGRVGALFIILVALYFLMQACRSRLETLAVGKEEPILAFNIKPMGVIVQILKEPSKADIDSSWEISLREAFFLGLALAMDALGAGIGVAMAGFNILYTALAVAVLKFILINTGIILGKAVKTEAFKKIFVWVPGIILLSIGIIEIV